MKTIFITCTRGIISRNILSTPALGRLRSRSDLHIVLVVPQHRVELIGREFGGSNVLVTGLAAPPPTGLPKVLWVMATNLLSSHTRNVQRRAKFSRDHNLFDFLASLALAGLGRVRLVRRLFRAMAARLDPGRECYGLLERYRPDLVFATDVYELADTRLIRAARRYGIRTVGMIRSWDNVTSKTLLSAIPDRLLVNTGRIGQEAERYGDVPGNRISIVGVPHYDRYRPEFLTPRVEFFRKLGLDHLQKLILFTPPAESYLRGDPATALILEAIAPLGAQVLVRMPLVGQSGLADRRPPPGVVFDQPGTSPDFLDVHLTPASDRHLADSLGHADLVITWASTMIIDAAVFDKPIILVGFDASPRPFSHSIRQYYDYDHHRAILASGGVRLAKSAEELRTIVRGYLQHPERDRQGRAWIRSQYCGWLGGGAGERLGQLLLAELERPSGGAVGGHGSG